MRFLFIVLFLVSFGSVSMCAVNETYFCIKKTYIDVSRKTGKLTNFPLDQKKFTFKRTRDEIIFNPGKGYFNSSEPLKIIRQFIGGNTRLLERFRAISYKDPNKYLDYKDGYLAYSANWGDKIIVIIADCEIL